LSPLEELYLVLAALYLVDCLHWVRRDARVFVVRWKRFSMQAGGALFGNDSFGLNLAWPLPPLGTLYVCDAPLAQLPELGELRADGRRLLAGRSEIARASSPRQAALWAEELGQHAPSALERRERERYDTRAIAERRAAADSARARVLPFALAQFVLCFVLAPLAIEQIGLVPLLPWLLGALLAVQLAGLVAFARAHARFAPEARGERRGELAAIALSPPGLMRAADLFTRDLFAGRATLAVASVLLERADFEREAGRQLREARHPAHATPEAQSRLRALERFLREQQLDPDHLDAPPERLGEDCRAYCPRCQMQYVNAAFACERCSGLALVAFARAREQSPEAHPRAARGS